MPKKPSEKPPKAEKAVKKSKATKVEAAPKAVAKAVKATKAPAGGKIRKGPSLLVVESPAKERTISRFLKDDFIVKSSFVVGGGEPLERRQRRHLEEVEREDRLLPVLRIDALRPVEIRAAVPL